MIAIYIDKSINKFQNEIKYTFDFMFKTLGYEYKYIKRLDQLLENDILFFYGLIEPNDKEAYVLAFHKIMFYIPVESVLMQPGFLKKEQIQEYVREIKYLKNTPIISTREIDTPIFYYKNEDLFYGSYKFDLVGNIFFNLINYEQFNRNDIIRDKYSRIPDSDSNFSEYAFYPYINALLWLMEQSIQDAVKERKSYFILKKEYWPQAETFAVAFSHNVEKLKKWNFLSIIKTTLSDIFIFYKVRYIINNIVSKIKFIVTNIEEYWNFDVIEDIENIFHIRSTFFFGVESQSPEDIDYTLQEDDIKSEIINQIEKNNEVSLLASSSSYKDDIIQRQKEKLVELLKTEKIGIRQNLLKYDQEITTGYHNKYDFYYDSSRSFYEQNGYKNGIGFPFYNYSINRENTYDQDRKFFKSNCLEIPLTFSDRALMLSKVKLIKFEKAKNIAESLIESIETYNGIITFNFSVQNFSDIRYDKQLYSYILEKITEKNVYINTYMEVANWWKKREAVIITEEKFGIYLYFPYDMEKFTVSIFGKFNIYEVEGTENKIVDKKVFLFDIKSDTKVKIKLTAEISGDEDS